MKKISVLFLLLIGVMMLAACNDGETYADQKKRETAAINAFIQKNKIKVISESQFYAQDSTTDVSQNEYVLFLNLTDIPFETRQEFPHISYAYNL